MTRRRGPTYTAWDLEPFARDCGYAGPPFRWDEERRGLLRAELDAAFFHLYGISHEDADYILDTFPIVRRKDIEKHGCYRTKEKILEIYDAFANAQRTGQPYQSSLNPPPGPPVEPLPAWSAGAERPDNWPSHIHPPRDAHEEPFKLVAAPAIITRSRGPLDIDRVIQAWSDVRDGTSPDYVVACPEVNARFLTRAHELGLDAADKEINQALLNARKASKLKGIKTTREYRLPRTAEPWTFASEWAVRHLQRELVIESDRLIALDEILCDPTLAARFDTLAAKIKPGLSPLEYRWVALGLRKKGKANPDADEINVSLDRELRLDDALSNAPTDPGLYLFASEDLPIFVNHTNNLRTQLQHHVEASGQDLVPNWLLAQSGPVTRLSYLPLPSITRDRLQEFRITTIAHYRPWLNLLDVTGAV